MRWDRERVEKVAAAYRHHHALPASTREERLSEAEDADWWAVELVISGGADGTLLLDVIDAMLHDPLGDADFRAYVAAGPLEDLITGHLPNYQETLTLLVRRDPVWSEALGSIWLDRTVWEQLPETLRRYVREPGRSSADI